MKSECGCLGCIPPGTDKRACVATAKRLLPAAEPHLTRAKSDSRAEALLLALQTRERRADIRHRATGQATPDTPPRTFP